MARTEEGEDESEQWARDPQLHIEELRQVGLQHRVRQRQGELARQQAQHLMAGHHAATIARWSVEGSTLLCDTGKER